MDPCLDWLAGLAFEPDPICVTEDMKTKLDLLALERPIRGPPRARSVSCARMYAETPPPLAGVHGDPRHRTNNSCMCFPRIYF
jgi:hypothetical protein